MAAFDAELNRQNPNPNPIPDPNRMTFLEDQFQYLLAEVTHLRGIVNQPPPTPPPPQQFRPNLNLPQPPQFSGFPSELPTFKLKLFQFLMGNHNTYIDSESQILFAGSLLIVFCDRTTRTGFIDTDNPSSDNSTQVTRPPG